MKATLTILGKKYEAKGTTPTEAISKLSYGGFARLKSVLTINDGEKEKTVVLYPTQTLRLFSKNELMREIAIKQVALKF